MCLCLYSVIISLDCVVVGTRAACMEAEVDSHEYLESSGLIACDTDSGSTGVCQKIGLSDAGSALAGALGSTASIVWALGLLASGQSSTMTITYAGQFVLDGFFEVQSR